jgi:hypothetical protein
MTWWEKGWEDLYAKSSHRLVVWTQSLCILSLLHFVLKLFTVLLYQRHTYHLI